MPEDLGEHYDLVIDAFQDGEVTPFLGAGVNLCSRKPDIVWNADQSSYLPNGSELAKHLGEDLAGPHRTSTDLARISQAVELLKGKGKLYKTLHEIFDRDYPPTPLHQFLAGIPKALRLKGCLCRYPLIVTTNYDDLMERAFVDAGQEFDLVYYVAEGRAEQQGKFIHRAPDGTDKVIEKPNEYQALSLERRPVVLKIHGAVSRHPADERARMYTATQDSYVITEDHYIDYLTRANLNELLPARLVREFLNTHLLFLGYGLRDWNLRVILHRILKENDLNWTWWAVQKNPDDLDKKFWSSRKVEILDVDLDAYVGQLDQRLQSLPGKVKAVGHGGA